jgi:hypothetical protein
MIKNASNLTLEQNQGTLPQMAGAFQNWFQPMTFVRVVKSLVNFLNVETLTPITFQGVMQPLSPEKIILKSEGQRSWIWQQLHAEPTLILIPDEIVTYDGKNYRVMEKLDYQKYEFIEYHLIEDYI